MAGFALRRARLLEGTILAVALVACWSSGALAQDEKPRPPSERARPADTLNAGQTEQGGPYFTVDTIMVVEDIEGTVWGDWYVSPQIGAQVERAIEREGQLSGRTWLESGAPIRDLSLGPPAGRTQRLTFVDKGVALGFWEPGEVDYEYVVEGPWKTKTRGRAQPAAGSGASAERMQIPLPLPPPGLAARSAKTRDRLARVDISYKARSGPIPRGRFTIYLFYVDERYGYRIVGVGY